MAEYVEIKTEFEMKLALEGLQESVVISYDLETTGLDALTKHILLYGFRGDSSSINYVTASHDYAAAILFACRGKVFLAHNAAFEYMFTSVRFPDMAPQKWFDTMLAEQLLTAGLIDVRHDLDGVVRRYCGNVHGGKALQTSFIDQNPDTFVATHEQLAYLADDVAFLHDVMHAQLARLRDEGLLRVARLEMAALPAFAEMQLRGFYLNLDRHAVVLAEYTEREHTARVALEAALEPLWWAHLSKTNMERDTTYAFCQAELDDYMETQGIRRLTKDTNANVREEVARLRKERDKYKPIKVEPINVASSEQVLAALAVAGVFPTMQNPDGTEKASLDKNVLREMQHLPLIRMYGEWSKPAKVVSTYGETLRSQVSTATARVHAGYRQCGAASGRTSSVAPNQQNMPPAIRQCFEAQAGNSLIVADAKNQEGRLAAALSGDEVLLGVFRDGVDWHSLTATAAWPHLFPTWRDVPKDSDERARAKNGNFSSIYGGTGRTLFSRGYVDDVETGDKIMHAIAETYPTLATYSQRQANNAVQRGHVETISGRKRYFRLGPQPLGEVEETKEWKRKRGGIRRSAMNHPVQGSGADTMKLAMVFLLPLLKEKGWMFVAMVHDELVFEGPQDNAEEVRLLVLDAFEKAAACFTSVIPIPADAVITKEWSKH